MMIPPPLVVGTIPERALAGEYQRRGGDVPEKNEAVQNEIREAVQIEAQARVNQDPSKSHLRATAWPRQMLAVMCATQRPLYQSGRGDYDPPLAGSSGGEGRLLALSWGRPGGQVRDKGTGQVLALGWAWSRRWWYRLGCRARSFLFEVHLPIRKSGVWGRDPPDEEITETVISRDKWYL